MDTNETEMLEHIVQQMETERQVDRSAAIADMRFDFIERLCEQTVVKPKESKEDVYKRQVLFFPSFCVALPEVLRTVRNWMLLILQQPWRKVWRLHIRQL